MYKRQGHSILNRAFYGLPDLTNADGLHTNAIYGFLTIMFKILEEEKPDYLTVAFDVHAPTSVSYTHLDVYKRQVHTYTCKIETREGSKRI